MRLARPCQEKQNSLSPNARPSCLGRVKFTKAVGSASQLSLPPPKPKNSQPLVLTNTLKGGQSNWQC